MGGDFSFTHTLLLRSRDKRGRGRAEAAHSRPRVCGAIQLNFLQPQTSNAGTKRADGHHANRSGRSEVNLQRVSFFVVFLATPCQHTSLFLIELVYYGQ